MNGFIGDIEKLTKENNFFRRVLFTGAHAQLVVMCLKPGEQIGREVHPLVDQFFRIEQGSGEVTINDVRTAVAEHFAIIVPAGSTHNIVNNGAIDLKLYTLYSPPNHPDGTVHKTYRDAVEAEKHH